MNLSVFNPIETERLILRQWNLETDLLPFFELNLDAEVMEFFPHPLTRAESDALAQRFFELIQQQGWGFWAIELKQTRTFIGFCGLYSQPDQFDFSPCVEIGWRLAKNSGAKAMLLKLRVQHWTLRLIT